MTNRRQLLKKAGQIAGLGLASHLTGCGSENGNQSTESGSPPQPDSALPPPKPNIVFLMSDDQRYDSLGATGNPIVASPNLDALAREGINFKNSFVTTSICSVSRVSVLTGQYMKRHGINDFTSSITNEQLRSSFPAIFRENGWRTGFVGKWGIGEDLPIDAYDEFYGFSGQGTYFPNGPNGDHLTRELSGQSSSFITNNAASPFMLSLSFKAPHGEGNGNPNFLPDPLYASLYENSVIPRPGNDSDQDYLALPEAVRNQDRSRWFQRYENDADFQENVKNYFRLITGIDAAVGEIVSTLKSLGLYDNTIIVYTSDNGFFLGEHQLAGKWLMYEESIRIPLFIKPVTQAKPITNNTVDAMALNIDIAPTLLDMAGLPIPDTMQGQSLWTLIQDPLATWRSDWYYEFSLPNTLGIPASEGIRTEQWKFIRYAETDEEELFDLSDDAMEINNLANVAAYETQRQLLSRRLTELRDFAA